jgi:hypothetical protein
MLVAAGTWWLVAACSGGQSGAEGPPIMPGEPGEPVLPGRGQAECAQDDDCRDKLEMELEALASPAPRAVEISASRCEWIGISLPFGSVEGNHCICDKADGGKLYIGPVGVGCYTVGRDGQCLFGDDGGYTDCDTNDPNACSAICEDAAARVEADSSRPVDTELLLAECRDSSCRSVVSLNGHCYGNRDYQAGREFDCSLGAEGILQASDASNAPPVLTPDSEDQAYYRPGTSATLWLEVWHDWYGTALAAQTFGATAQFYTTIEGVSSQAVEVLDPLDGIDDCGVRRFGSVGTSPSFEFLSVERAVLLDADTEHVFEEFASGAEFYSYDAELTAAGVVPRHGESYGFAASGGSFGVSIELGGIVLPEALALPELERQSRFERGSLELTWAGRGSAPLFVSLAIAADPSASPDYTIECSVEDDGAFSVPPEVLEAAPDGIVLATFSRANRRVHSSGGKSVQTIAAVTVYHRFALGPACDGSASMAACQLGASQVRAAYEACGAEPPPIATLCPDYVSESCSFCPAFFECQARATTCGAAGLTLSSSGCSCP